jgi:hypothetical protein
MTHPVFEAADLVTIRTFTSESEVNIAKSALEAFGITSMISRDDCGGQRPSLTLAGGIRLIVRSEDSGPAEDVLTNAAESNRSENLP